MASKWDISYICLLLFSVCLCNSLKPTERTVIEKRQISDIFPPGLQAPIMYPQVETSSQFIPLPLSPVGSGAYYPDSTGYLHKNDFGLAIPKLGPHGHLQPGVGGGYLGKTFNGAQYHGPTGYIPQSDLEQIITDRSQQSHSQSGGGSYLGGVSDGSQYHDTGRYLKDDRHVADNHGQKSFISDRSDKRKGSEYGQGSEGEHVSGHRRQEVSGGEEDAGHRKGHHTSGFHSTYHKDESERNTNFYDDEHDRGNKGDVREYETFYGDHGAGGLRGGSHGSEFESGTHEVKGERGEGKSLHSLAGGHDDYSRKNYANHRTQDIGKNNGDVRFYEGDASHGVLQKPHIGYY